MKRTTLTAFLGAVAWPLLTAGSCATTSEPKIITKEVLVPVPVSCVPNSLASAPSYPDTDEALRHADDEGFLKLLTAGRDLRMARLLQLEPVVKKCQEIPTTAERKPE